MRADLRRASAMLFCALVTALLVTHSCKTTKQQSKTLNRGGDDSPTVDPRARLNQQLAALKEIGFDESQYSEKGKVGLRKLVGGEAIPFPLPKLAWDAAIGGIFGEQTEADAWLADGTIPISWNRPKSTKASLGLGDAVYDGDQGITVVTKTCLQCHGGTVAGYTVAGLPHSHFDAKPIIGTLKSTLPKIGAFNVGRKLVDPLGILRGVSNWASPKKEAFDSYVQDFKSYAENFFMPPFDYAYSRGDNHGPYSVWFMAARMNNPGQSGLLAGSDANKEVLSIVENAFLPTVDTLPWWNIKFKKRAYWFWDATYHSPAAFNLNFYTPRADADNLQDLESHVRKFKKKVETIDEVLQFARETKAPAMPPRQQVDVGSNWELVLEGSQLYHEKRDQSDDYYYTCAQCHGSYTFDPVEEGVYDIVVDYPNTGLEDVGTDPMYNEVLQKFKPAARNINATAEFYHNYRDRSGNKIITEPKYAPFSYIVTKKGYTSPVLVGIWATAPYLHNGSVPTLGDLFASPDQRPEIWGRKVWQPLAYDFNKVGLAYDKIDVNQWLELRDDAKLLHLDKDLDSEKQIEYRRFYISKTSYRTDGLIGTGIGARDREIVEGKGRSNKGHLYGTGWTPQEKKALLYFMKALGPMNAPDAPVKIREIRPKEQVGVWEDGNYLDPEYGPDQPRPR